MHVPDWLRCLRQFTSLLFRQWWFTAFAILAVISTVSTFVPAFYSRFFVPRLVPLLVFVITFFAATFRLFCFQNRDHSLEVSKLKGDIERLRGGSFDGQKLAQAQRTVESYTSNQRDLLRYLLMHDNPTAAMIHGATRITPEQVYHQDLQPLEQQGIVVRDASKAGLLGIVRFSVTPAWAGVFKYVLYPRRENVEPPAYE
jgi:hypothetical protein